MTRCDRCGEGMPDPAVDFDHDAGDSPAEVITAGGERQIVHSEPCAAEILSEGGRLA
jgi:hypothetical protein